MLWVDSSALVLFSLVFLTTKKTGEWDEPGFWKSASLINKIMLEHEVLREKNGKNNNSHGPAYGTNPIGEYELVDQFGSGIFAQFEMNGNLKYNCTQAYEPQEADIEEVDQVKVMIEQI